MRPLYALALMAVACGSSIPESRPGGPGADPTSTGSSAVAPALPPSSYALLLPPQLELRFEVAPGRFGVVSNNRRVIVDARGTIASIPEDAFAVHRAEALPNGGGFLFLTSVGAGIAPTFDGEIRIVVSGSVSEASVGPGMLLARRANGAQVAVDLATGAPKKGLPLGLADVAAVDGLGVGLGHGGRTYLSTDGAKWADVTSQLDFTPTSLSVDKGSVIVVSQELGVAARAAAKGGFSAAALPDASGRRDEQWPSSQGPMQALMTRGAPYGDGRAIVAEASSVFVVSLSTGQIVHAERGVLPPGRVCDAVAAGQDVLFVCPTGSGTSVFSRSLSEDKTTVEHTFTAPGFLHVGAGAVVFSGPCRSQVAKPGAACLRKGDGTWVDAGRPELSDTPPEAPLRVIAWVPKPKGALLVVAGKGGGIWDLTSGDKRVVPEADQVRLQNLFTTAGSIIQRFAVADDGTLVGTMDNGQGFHVSADGQTVEVSPFQFPTALAAGSKVLGAQGDRLWQSTDRGWTFTEVATPPIAGSVQPRACSAVGCLVGEFARVGWDPEAPLEVRPKSRSFANAPEDPAIPRPLLRCELAGTPSRRALPPGDLRFGFGVETLRQEEGSIFAMFPRGARHPASGDLEATNLRAAITGRLAIGPDGTLGGRDESWRIRVLEPFDPKATVRDQSLRIRDVFDAAHAAGGLSPDPALGEERGSSMIVLSDPPSTVLTIGEGPALWIRPPAAPLPLSLGADFFEGILSAVQTGPDELTVLTGGASGAVIAVGRGRAERMFGVPFPPAAAVPPAPDALAIGPDGKLALIRVPSLHPPTADQPALLLRPQAPPTALAPWSTLAAAGTPACEGMTGHRAVVVMAEPWLTLGSAEATGASLVGFAQVRWNAERVCLDAVELPAHSFNLEIGAIDSYMAVRFGKNAGAGHMFTAEGATLFEPRSCTLVAP